MDSHFRWTHALRAELDGVYARSHQRGLDHLQQHDDLLVGLASLRSDFDHFVDEHWIPMQRFAHGVVSGLAVYAGADPISPPVPGRCSTCTRPLVAEGVNGSTYPIAPHNSPFLSFDAAGSVSSDSLPSLESINSSSSSGVFVSAPSSPSFCLPSGPEPSPHHDVYRTYETREELEAYWRLEESLQQAEGFSSGSPPGFEDADNRIPEAASVGVRGGDGENGGTSAGGVVGGWF